MNLSSLTLNPNYMAPSAWWQHVPIAHWLVSMIKPTIIVELGSHYGVSLFAFCEAADRFSPNSFIYAVDTWAGDEHAGLYPEDVYNQVAEHWSKYHRARARLVRSTFDEASKYFEEASIDVLHIDGLHTYEAVKHDFETWLPKMKEDSIIMFHDINVRERDFGVWKLWQELRNMSDYRTHEVLNGHGLGILIKGSRLIDILSDSASFFPLLTAKGVLLEKLSEASNAASVISQALSDACQAKDIAEIALGKALQEKLEIQQSGLENQQAKSEAEQAKAEAEQAKAEAEQAKDSLSQIVNSTSWKAMGPFRKAANFCKKLLGVF